MSSNAYLCFGIMKKHNEGLPFFDYSRYLNIESKIEVVACLDYSILTHDYFLVMNVDDHEDPTPISMSKISKMKNRTDYWEAYHELRNEYIYLGLPSEDFNPKWYLCCINESLG